MDQQQHSSGDTTATNGHRRRNRHNSSYEPVGTENVSINSTPVSGRKRPFSGTGCSDKGSFVKLFVLGIPRTITEHDIQSLFGNYGHILEVKIPKDNTTGQQKDYCFVKFAKVEEAEEAIGELHNNYTFPWGSLPIEVRYADGERNRLQNPGILCNEVRVVDLHQDQLPRPLGYSDSSSFVKLYVRGIPRTATHHDIWFLFAKYGNIIEVIFLTDKRSGQQQDSCFIKYEKIEEAERAIGALHNKYTLPWEDRFIEVKYAEGELDRLRHLGIFHNEVKNADGERGQLRLPTGAVDRPPVKVFVSGLNKFASKEEIAEVFSPYGLIEEIFLLLDDRKQSRGLGFIQFSHSDMAVAAIDALNGRYVMRGCKKPLFVQFADPRKPKPGESRPGQYCIDTTGQPLLPNAAHLCKPSTVSSPSPALPASMELKDLSDCDWSEHICPDGYTYYYNCVTCESKWEKPEEYRLYEQQFQNSELS